MTDAPGLLARTVQALQDSGRLVRTDWDTETFEVLAGQDGGEPTSGIVLTATKSVVFYAVWADPVPETHRDAVLRYVAHADTDLSTSAFEFDPAVGILSVRAGIEFGSLAETIDSDALQTLIVNALDEAEHVAGEHRPEIARLLQA